MQIKTKKKKRWTTRLIIFILFCLTALTAYNYFEKPFLKNVVEEVVETISPVEKKIVKKELSTEAKLAQLIAVPVDLNSFEKGLSPEATESAKDPNRILSYDEKVLKWVDDNEPGFVIYFGEEISSSAANLASSEIKNKFTEEDYLPLIAVDHEGGTVQRLSGFGFTELDSWKSLTKLTNEEQQEIFKQTASELAAVNIDVVFAPVLDLAENNSVLGSRAADDSDQLYQAAQNYIYALSRENIMPVIKHFPGIGSIQKDLHFGSDSITVSKEDTAIFQRVLDKFPNLGVMTAHVRIEDKLDGKICTLSNDCLKDLIENYPKALLFTDDLLMDSAKIQLGTSEEKEITEIAIEAIESGNDVLIFGRGTEPILLDQVLYALEKEYNDSASFKEQVDRSVAKILELKK